jgi:hypothetical protein
VGLTCRKRRETGETRGVEINLTEDEWVLPGDPACVMTVELA